MAARISNHAKIILTIALKDIAQATKDRTILGVIIGVFMLILPSQLIPLVLQSENIPLAVVYGSEPTYLANALSDLPDTSAFSVRTLPDIKEEIASGRSNIIGLALPEDFSSKISTNKKITIEAYLPHWTAPEEADRLVQHFENKIDLITENPVEITIVDDQIYPDENTRGAEVMFILQLINVTMTLTLVMVPQLMMVEKETHTLDALLISPAHLSDLVAGKGLVGTFFAVIGVLIIVLMNMKIVAHWPLLILSIISGIVFAVLTGLLIGLLFDNFQQASLVLSLVAIAAIGPAFVDLILTVDLPETVTQIMNLLPSKRLADLLLMSLMKTVDIQTALLGLGVIWIINLLLFSLNMWQIKAQMK